MSATRRPACRRIALLCLAALLATVQPGWAARRAVVVSIDGLRPDVALRANMPALRSLMARGSFTMYAITTDVAVTLPSHTSMLTGVTPAKHGIHYNSDPGPGDPTSPAWPTLFELAHAAGRTAAMSAGKSKFSIFASPGLLDRAFLPATGQTASDSMVVDAAVGWIVQRPLDVLFVHLAGPDIVGHAAGWGSPEQVRAVEAADRALGRLLDALERGGASDSTLVIVSADHGGAVRTHGGLDARSHYIPWIAAGPGVRADYDLTREPGLEVHTEDTFATACAWLGLVPPRAVDGHDVSAIYGRPPSPPAPLTPSASSR